MSEQAARAKNALANEARVFLETNPDLTAFDAFLIDLSGNAVGKRYPARDLEHVYAQGTTFCAATPLVDARGLAWDVLGRGFSDGDPGTPMVAVPGGLAPVP